MKMEKAIDELVTIRDFMRYGVTRFNKAGISYVGGMGGGFGNAFDEAVFLVMETLKLSVDDLESFVDARLTQAERLDVMDVIDRRIKTRKPSAYITNKIYIQDMPFYIDERVNIPRPLLGDLLMSELIGGEDAGLIDNPEEIENILDLCAGSGCFSIIAASVFSSAKIDAIDLSPEALEVAKRNVLDYHLQDRIELSEGDLFKPIKDKKYDLIMSSAPYLSSKNLEELPPEYAHEPRRAIGSGNDGLRIVKRIINSASDYLEDGGILLCEVGEGSREQLEAEYPHIEFMWIDVEGSNNEAFWLNREDLLF